MPPQATFVTRFGRAGGRTLGHRHTMRLERERERGVGRLRVSLPRLRNLTQLQNSCHATLRLAAGAAPDLFPALTAGATKVVHLWRTSHRNRRRNCYKSINLNRFGACVMTARGTADKVRIARWLKRHGLAKHVRAFEEQNIGFDVLPELGDEDLKELGVPLGDRKRLLKAIAGLRMSPESADDAMTSATARAPPIRPSIRNGGSLRSCFATW